jgi:hypothetical protein
VLRYHRMYIYSYDILELVWAPLHGKREAQLNASFAQDDNLHSSHEDVEHPQIRLLSRGNPISGG